MGAKTSPEMIRARRMIMEGATPYRAAKDVGLRVSSITRSKWYKERIAAFPSTAALEETPMDRARRLVEGGHTAYAASKVTGVSQSSISRAAWYKTFKKTEK